MYKPTTNNTNNTRLTFHSTDLPTWETEPSIGLGFTQNARQTKLGMLLALKRVFSLVITVISSPFIGHFIKRILVLLTFPISRGNTQNGCHFMCFILQHLPCWGLFSFCDITNQLVASLLIYLPQFSVCVSVISYKHRYHDHSFLFIVARGVYLLLALKMMRRKNVCFLNYQMLKERGNSRDTYGT